MINLTFLKRIENFLPLLIRFGFKIFQPEFDEIYSKKESHFIFH